MCSQPEELNFSTSRYDKLKSTVSPVHTVHIFYDVRDAVEIIAECPNCQRDNALVALYAIASAANVPSLEELSNVEL